MTDVTTAEARKNLADLLNRVAYTKERVVVTRRGREIAAIVSMDELNLLDSLRTLLRDREVQQALEELDSGASVAWSDLKGDLTP